MILKYLVHKNISRRVLASIIIFYTIFFLTVIISYFLLPDGFLKKKNSILDFDTSMNPWALTFQIFSFNCMSIILFSLANLISSAKFQDVYLPYGYLGLSVQFILNGLTLGTWSFTEVMEAAPDLSGRLFRTFEIWHRAGLWEMTGQILIVCALADIAIIKTKGKEAIYSKFKDIKISKKEIAVALLGISFMILGAMIESFAIINET